MTQLILAALFFHCSARRCCGHFSRGRAIEKLGENVYRAAFSLLSLLGIVWLAHAYRVAGYIETWGQLAWFKPIAAFLMLVAFLLVVLGMTTPNPMAVGGENLLMANEQARGIQRVTRHPFLWGVAVWAFVHLIANGDVASLVLCVSLLVVAFVGMISIDAKRKKSLWPALGQLRCLDFDHTLPGHQGWSKYAGNHRIQSLAIGCGTSTVSRRDTFSPSLVRGFPVVLRTFE